MLLSKFGNEVLSKGATAVLPQNLSREWLDRIQKMADDFLDANFENGECLEEGFVADPILSACVSEILSYLHHGYVDITEREMFEMLTMYALTVTIETVGRETDLGLEQPSLDDIFTRNRFAQLKRIKPELSPILETVCLAEKE